MTRRFLRGMALAMGLGVVFSLALAGCGSGNDASSAPATISPEMEAKTQEMLKNKSQDYNERFKNKGNRPG